MASVTFPFRSYTVEPTPAYPSERIFRPVVPIPMGLQVGTALCDVLAQLAGYGAVEAA